MENIFGGLFQYEDNSELNDFILEMDSSEALSLISVALEYVQSKGVLSLEESFVIYKCINKLKEDEHTNNHKRDDDSDGDLD